MEYSFLRLMGQGLHILNHDAAGPGQGEVGADPGGAQQNRLVVLRENAGEVGLAAAFGADDRELALRPAIGGRDHREGTGIGLGDEEILAPQRHAHRPIEGKLLGH